MITPLNNSNQFIKQSVKIVKFDSSKLFESIKEELKNYYNNISISEKVGLISIDFDMYLSGKILKYLIDLTTSLNELYEENVIRSFMSGSAKKFNICFNLGWDF